MGTRLRGVHPELPKGLLELGGCSLIQRSLENLFARGITQIVLVTGYRADAYQAFLAANFSAVKTIHNPDFARTGSMHSLFLARPAVAGDFLLLESDLLYEPRALDELLRRPADDCILLSGATGQGDEVYAYSAASAPQRLNLLTKTLQPTFKPAGEFVGISRLTTAFFAAMCRHYETQIAFPSNYHYDDCLSDLSVTLPLHLLKIENLLWGEIDDPAHYERVVTRVLPALPPRPAAHAHPA